MGRPPKSKELKAIEGTLRPDRDRIPAKRTLNTTDLPEPQLELHAKGSHLFDALCLHLNDAGVLWQVDAMMLSMYCKNWELLQEAAELDKAPLCYTLLSCKLAASHQSFCCFFQYGLPPTA